MAVTSTDQFQSWPDGLLRPRPKVTILGGGGGVGSSLAFNLLLEDAGFEVVLVDSRPAMVESHVMDLEQVVEQSRLSAVRGGGDADLLDADVLVLAASAPFRLNTTRHVYLSENAAILSGLVEALAAGGERPGVIIVVTNPVDPLCTWLARQIDGGARSVVGYTLNDSLRLRTGIGRALGVAPGSVEAWVLGEHGESSVPLFHCVSVAGRQTDLTSAERAKAQEFLGSWYVRHVALDSGRSSTWATGLGVARMIRALKHDEPALWPASVFLRGEYGIEDVSLGVPATIGANGVETVHEWDLPAEDHAALLRSAELVRAAAESLEVGAAARGL